jgi:hypothetical protein
MTRCTGDLVRDERRIDLTRRDLIEENPHPFVAPAFSRQRLKLLRRFGLGDPRIICQDHGDDAHELGMVRDRKEIERRFDPHPRPVFRMDDGEPLGKSVGRIGIGAAIAEQARIRGPGRVEMRIAEEDLPIARLGGGERRGQGGQRKVRGCRADEKAHGCSLLQAMEVSSQESLVSMAFQNP